MIVGKIQKSAHNIAKNDNHYHFSLTLPASFHLHRSQSTYFTGGETFKCLSNLAKRNETEAKHWRIHKRISSFPLSTVFLFKDQFFYLVEGYF